MSQNQEISKKEQYNLNSKGKNHNSLTHKHFTYFSMC
ncbi:Uncharacterised protein [Escherichia coli]|uniref:Uncharacterized protein n=1 Tax=Escherichia coli TaxID=562 RepID=A0A376RJC7_ECOLX|nr:Uncharacterised protein [Escherichia coli]